MRQFDGAAAVCSNVRHGVTVRGLLGGVRLSTRPAARLEARSGGIDERRKTMNLPAADAEVTVRDAPEHKRFEILVGDVVAGFTVYQPLKDKYTFVHTEIDPAFGGRGLASVLIKAALDEMRSRGMGVIPQCPFVRRYIARHTDYLDLVPAAYRARFDLPLAPAAE